MKSPTAVHNNRHAAPPPYSLWQTGGKSDKNNPATQNPQNPQ